MNRFETYVKSYINLYDDEENFHQHQDKSLDQILQNLNDQENLKNEEDDSSENEEIQGAEKEEETKIPGGVPTLRTSRRTRGLEPEVVNTDSMSTREKQALESTLQYLKSDEQSLFDSIKYHKDDLDFDEHEEKFVRKRYSNFATYLMFIFLPRKILLIFLRKQ